MSPLGSNPVDDIPRLSGGLPFLGQAIAFHRDPISLIERGRELYGEHFSFPLFGKTVHALTGPAANEAFFRAPDTVLDARAAYRFTVPIFGDGLVYDAEPEIMDQQFRLIHPALREDKMQSFARFKQAEVEAYVESWGDSGIVDLLTTMKEITIRTAGRCLIGPEFRRDLATTFAHLYHDLESGINMVAFFAPHAPLPAMRRRDRARQAIVELLLPMIKSRRASGAQSDDFLGTLIAARTPDGAPISDHAIIGLLLALFFAGQHTSAVLATWTGILLMQHPEYFPPILAEQEAVIAKLGMTPAALRQLARLECCIKEAERLHPPLVMLMRKVIGRFEFNGHVLPIGDLALASSAVSHRNPKAFAEPDRYDPDRFAPPREEDRRTPFSLIGFGGGKHRCVGLAFAYQQVKVIWSLLLHRYEFELISPDQRPDYATFVVGPHQPCLVRYRRRMPGSGKTIAAAATLCTGNDEWIA